MSTDAAPSPPSPAAGQLLTDPPATVPWSSASVSGTNHVKMVRILMVGQHVEVVRAVEGWRAAG